LAALFFTQIRVDWRSRIFDMRSYFQGGGYDITSRRKVMQCRLVSALAASARRTGSIRLLLHQRQPTAR